jgi:two-component system KDP operon response regulator KdpE
MNKTKQRRLLLADNTSDYRRSLHSFLELEDYQVEEAASVEEAKEKLESVPVDLALVDLRLTTDEDDYDISGLAVAKKAAERGIPCIIITAFPSVEATRLALRSRGIEPPLALDFIPKASGPHAVLNAIEVVLSHRGEEQERSPRDLVVDLERGLVWRNEESLDLSRQQYALLAYLCRKEGAVCSPEELYKVVYGENMPPTQASADKRLERLVNRLRQKIEEDPSEPCHLIKVHGRGYRLAINH